MLLQSLFTLLSTSSTLTDPSIPAPPEDAYRAMAEARVPAPPSSSDDEDADDSSPYDDFLTGSKRVLGELLAQPESPYSPLLASPAWSREAWWQRAAERIAPGESSFAKPLAALQHQIGATKARPGYEVSVRPESQRRYKGRQAAANAIKAGVDADIFERALRRHPRHLTQAAAEAVAIQIVRDRSATTGIAHHAALNIRADVVDRYLDSNASRFSLEDGRYAGELLRHAVVTGHPTFNERGERQIPAAFRVARVAAAYADRRGYARPGGYCHGDAPAWKPLPSSARPLTYRPLCFVAATDRAVYEWYLRKARFEAAEAVPEGNDLPGHRPNDVRRTP
ncbi:hypothetical protein [Luteibacter sp. CQ10]|uniref:hypothetical protein n=1 Tax=Luteibacter sp. CQ10 TaxID=2805821 RepID=UPI0034A3DA0C